MLMTSVDEFNLDAEAFGVYPELAGKRVLITGVTSQQGVDIVRVFAEHRTRLILQLDEANETTLALLEHAAPLAIDLSVTAEKLTDNDSIVRFARKSVAEFGGVDIVINIVTLDPGTAVNGSLADVERRVCDLMLLPCLVARVAANRMRLTHTEGLILNIAVLPPNANAAARAFAGVAKATLTAMTRSEAKAWADQGLRFNAVAPEVASVGPRTDGTRLAGEADVAALALYLGSGNGRNLAGHVFEAEPAWTR